MTTKDGRARILCLANSWKRSAHCVAGIDLATGRWVRPVTDTADGGVPEHIRKLRKREPALLDILDIPLAADGPDFGFECENRLILPGRWYLDGRAQPAEVLRYVARGLPILHNDEPWVTLPFMHTLPFAERRTLQLVETVAFRAHLSRRQHGLRNVWIGTLTDTAGQQLTANITDPVYCAHLDLGHAPAARCLVTVSLSMPWRRPDRPDDEERCYKLIAGVIELNDRDALTPDDLATVPF
jgi:hypothetical protein